MVRARGRSGPRLPPGSPGGALAGLPGRRGTRGRAGPGGARGEPSDRRVVGPPAHTGRRGRGCPRLTAGLGSTAHAPRDAHTRRVRAPRGRRRVRHPARPGRSDVRRDRADGLRAEGGRSTGSAGSCPDVPGVDGARRGFSGFTGSQSAPVSPARTGGQRSTHGLAAVFGQGIDAGIVTQAADPRQALPQVTQVTGLVGRFPPGTAKYPAHAGRGAPPGRPPARGRSGRTAPPGAPHAHLWCEAPNRPAPVASSPAGGRPGAGTALVACREAYRLGAVTVGAGRPFTGSRSGPGRPGSALPGAAPGKDAGPARARPVAGPPSVTFAGFGLSDTRGTGGRV